MAQCPMIDKAGPVANAIEHFMIQQDGSVQDPYPTYAALREVEPVYQSRSGVWLVTGYEANVKLLRDPRISRWEAAKHDMGAPQTEDPDLARAMHAASLMLINRDEPDHTRLRKLVRLAFLPATVESWRPRIADVAREIVTRARELPGEFDFLEEVAFPLPEIVICQLLGVPHDDRKLWSKWSRDIVSFNRAGGSAADFRRVQDASLSFFKYMRDFVGERRANLGDDMLSQLIQAEEAGDTLTEDEVIGNMIMLVQAGHETTANLVSNAMFHILTKPALFDELKRDPSRVDLAFEEFMRAEASAHMCLPRTPLEDIEYEGVTIPAGSKVMFILAAGNRDPTTFDRPNDIAFGRPDIAKHIGFGFGPHSCMGQHLARIEGCTMIREIVTGMPDLQLVGTPRWKPGKPRLLENFTVRLTGD